MTVTDAALAHDSDVAEPRDRGIRFLVLSALAVWVLSGPFGSSGRGGSGDDPGWNVVIQVAPAAQGAIIGLVALGWLVTRWQRHDRLFVTRVRRSVLTAAWGLVAVAIIGSFVAMHAHVASLAWTDSPPVVVFPLELVDAVVR